MILYSAKSIIDREGLSAYRITKFNNGEVESSYICNLAACDCPAGVRPTCRHRQMLPNMIAEGIINTYWFLDWDGPREVVDFEGTPRSAYDPAEREAPQDVTPIEGELITVPTADGWNAKDVTPAPAQLDLPLPATLQSNRPWRRF